jgi:hypothetical protein
MSKVPSSPDADLKLLLKEIMPVTQQGLEKQMGFRTVAILLKKDGTVRRIDPEAGTDIAAREVAGRLRQEVRREVTTGAVRSAAVAADVMIWRNADGDQASNAVSVHVEHQDGYCVDLLIPYKVRKGLLSRITSKPHVIFRKMVAQESEPVFW